MILYCERSKIKIIKFANTLRRHYVTRRMETIRCSTIVLIVYFNVILLNQDLVNSGDTLHEQFETTRGDVDLSQNDSTDSVDQIEAIKRSLADVLHYKGLEDPPHPDYLILPMPSYLDLMFTALQQFDHSDSGLSDQVWGTGGQTIWGVKPTKETKHRNTLDLTFMIQAEVKRVQISRAELVFTKSMLHRIQVQVCTGSRTFCTLQRWAIADTFINSGRSYDVFDVTPMFSHWLRDHIGTGTNSSVAVILHIIKSMHTLGVNKGAITSRDSPVLVIYGNVSNFPALQPLIRAAVVTEHQTRGRRRRSVSGLNGSEDAANNPMVFTPGSSSMPCTFLRWHVSFDEIGWDQWVYLPSGYPANLCVGECNSALVDMVNATNHAVIKELIGNQIGRGLRAQGGANSPDRSMLGISCVPLSTSPISVLFRSGNSTYVTRILAGMTVNHCGCA